MSEIFPVLLLAIVVVFFGEVQSSVAEADTGDRGPGISVLRYDDIAYAGTTHPRQRLDLMVPDQRGHTPLPVIVFIHGGGWRNGDKKGGLRRLESYVRTGRYAGVSVGYRLSGEATWPSQIHDCKAAIRWIRAHAESYGLDAQRMGVWGTSAGGHLVAMLGTSADVPAMDGTLGPHATLSSRVRCVVNFFGPTDFLQMNRTALPGATLDHDAANSPESLLMGGAIQQHPRQVATANPMTYVSPDDSPFLIVHGTRDPLVPFNQSELLHTALTNATVPSTLYLVEGGGHGNGFGPDVHARVSRFFDQNLGATRPERGDRTLGPALSPGTQPVKVFVLTGQSNMEGKGLASHLDTYRDDPMIKDTYSMLKEGDGWAVRNDVWITYPTKHQGAKHGPLTVGYGTKGDASIGPEFGFGHTLGEALDEPVVLIKVAWGGKSLAVDFRPPSAGLPGDAALQDMLSNARKKNPTATLEDVKARYGRYYRDLLEETRQALAVLGKTFPTLAGRPVEIAGIVWHQGFNDVINASLRETQYRDYTEWLAHFIQDLRRDLGAPNAPFIIGELSTGGIPHRGDFQRAQAAVAERPEFAGNVTFVPTAEYYDTAAHALFEKGYWKGTEEQKAQWEAVGNDRPYHYLGSGKTYYLKGKAFAEAMLERMKTCDPYANWIAPGVSRALARERSRLISDLQYTLHFTVPANPRDPIPARETVRCQWAGILEPMLLDFHAPAESVEAIQVNGKDVPIAWANDHLVIPAEVLVPGAVEIEISFLAGDGSLNRNPEFLYTLFVPDRARFAFPCFDQPDLRARFQLTLDVPETWQAVSNTLERKRISHGERHGIHFAETLPLPTYLFSFAAGQFQIEETTIDGRTMRMFHRETDHEKIVRNRDAIFDAHARSLDWMTQYTGIPYPFPKFDFVLIPSFQYGGMEHPGAILYRAESLLLETSATPLDALTQANLIAHETSHMWFGDLVTLAWFDDVWTKEVFAGFLASRMVNPMFPDINHELRFLLGHLPAAYAIDRTVGTHPISQTLGNLKDAGSLYGSIIYRKAPVIMRQLELRLGASRLQEGLREYLNTFAFDSASWVDLIAILDALTPEDLRAWSQAWVEEAGRAEVSASWESMGAASGVRITLTQSDESGAERLWPQELGVIVGNGTRLAEISIHLTDRTATGVGPDDLPEPAFVLPPGRSPAYGLFRLDPASRAYLLEQVGTLPDPVLRGVSWLCLWDGLMEGDIPPAVLLRHLMVAVEQEPDPLIVDRLLGYLQGTYWRYVSPSHRAAVTGELGRRLWARVEAESDPARKAMFFRAYRSIALADADVTRLRQLWDGSLVVDGLILAEPDRVALARELAVRGVPDWAAILDEQAERIANADRQDAFRFIRPFLDADPTVRAAAFFRLADPRQRAREVWVLEGLRWLHHPLREETSRDFLRPGLEWLRDIQATGDIFFPKAWLDASLGGHRSVASADIVRTFLNEYPDFPAPLRAKILQSADRLFRASTFQP